jgi:hypothetical protein
MTRRRHHIGLLVCGVVLMTGMVAPFVFMKRGGPGKGVHLSKRLSRELSGWEVRDVKLGANEFQTKHAEGVLLCDDYLFREYSQGSSSFSIYIAYWGPGKIARGHVGNHTPDICWVSNGAAMLEKKSEAVLSILGSETPRCEWRRFEMRDKSVVEVVFWHVVGGKVLYFDSSSPTRWLRDALHELVLAGKEQYFVRVSIQGGFDSLQSQDGLKLVLADIKTLISWKP